MHDGDMAQASKSTAHGTGAFHDIEAEGAPSREQAASRRQAIAERLEEVDARLAELQKAVRSALADAEYARQRAEADLAHAYKFAIEDFVKALLPFKDALETALVMETADIDGLKAGLVLSLKQLQAAFEKNGLVEICPQPGASFDPQKHRSVTKLEPDHMEPVVAGVEKKGYAINGRLIRPAAVTIAGKK